MEELNRLPPKYIATFIRQINFIQIFGINIFEDSKASFFKRRIRLFFFGGLLTIMLTSQCLYVFNINEMGAEFLDIVTAMSNIFIVLQDYIKMSIVTYKRDQIKELIMEIGKMWPTEIDNGKKERTLNSWTRRLKVFDDALFRAAIVALIFFELQPLIHLIYAFITNGDLQFQLPVQMHFVCPSSLQCPYTYALAYIFQFIVAIAVHMCIYVSCDFLLVDLTFDLIALFSLLRIDLENVIKSDSVNYNFEEDDCEDIKSIVKKHQKILSLSDTLNHIFGECIFSHVMISSMVICCNVFMAVNSEGFFLKYFTSALSIMLAILVIAWPGQMLCDTSFDIGVAAYQCAWYRKGKKFRKCVAIIIARSQKKCSLSALGFSYLTLEMFSKIITTAWSYVSLLNSMYEDTGL